jgi:hypothetical protein
MAAASNFTELIDLIARAERQLESAGGITDPGQRLLTLRGIYYGTAWSKDFGAERSLVRNLGFTIFTGFGRPPDPRPTLGTSLFNDLQNSQDVTQGRYKIDTGHALIGMEARTNRMGRDFVIPSQGGTGLEIVTWLGDLGGGAANLAWRRSASSRAASRSVSTVFVAAGSDYGAPINLEGDLAGYLIGATAITPGAPPLAFPRSTTIADLFRAYLPVNAAGRRRYFRRSREFLIMMGGNFGGSSSNRLRNRSAVVSTLTTKIREFATAYMLQRWILGQGRDRARVETACKHLPGAAQEVADTFVKALEASVRVPNRAIEARPPWGSATPPASACTSRPLQAAAREQEATRFIEEQVERGRRTAREWLRELEGAAEDVFGED